MTDIKDYISPFLVRFGPSSLTIGECLLKKRENDIERDINNLEKAKKEIMSMKSRKETKL